MALFWDTINTHCQAAIADLTIRRRRTNDPKWYAIACYGSRLPFNSWKQHHQYANLIY